MVTQMMKTDQGSLILTMRDVKKSSGDCFVLNTSGINYQECKYRPRDQAREIFFFLVFTNGLFEFSLLLARTSATVV